MQTDVWAMKPAWCQPWSIVATGGAVIGASWALLHNVVLTTLVSAAIGAWWYLFLGVMPAQYADWVRQTKTNADLVDREQYE